jgi:hypothetical protein
MFKNTFLKMAKDIIYKIKVPSKDIWYVQNNLENFDGLSLVTSASMEIDYGTFLVYTNSDFDNFFIKVFNYLKLEIVDLEILEKEIC